MHSSTYHFTSLVTPSHQKFWVTNSTVFYCPLCPPTGVSWCSLIISALSMSSLGTYTFSSLYIILSSFLYSSSLSIFTLACFISSTALTTSLSFTFDFLTFSNRSTPSTIISTLSVLLTSSHSGFTSVSSSLSLSTPTSQSGLLLKLSVFPILLSGMCLSQLYYGPVVTYYGLPLHQKGNISKATC